MNGSISVLTCIIDGDRESLVISAIRNALPESTIALRTCDPEILKRFITSESGQSQRILVFHDFHDFAINKELSISLEESPIFIDVAHLDLSDTHHLFQIITHATRERHETPESRSFVERSANFIMVVGSSGAPGCTTITANILWELSQSQTLLAIESDEHSHEMNFLLTGRGGKSDRIGNIEFRRSDPSLTWKSEASLLVMDSGVVQSIHDAHSDRRRHGRNFIDSINRAGIILYIAQPDLRQLNQFRKFEQELYSDKFPGLFLPVLNKYGENKENRAILRAMNENSFEAQAQIIARDNHGMERSRLKSLPLALSEPRSRSRRGIKALALTLLEHTHLVSVPSPRVTSQIKDRRRASH